MAKSDALQFVALRLDAQGDPKRRTLPYLHLLTAGDRSRLVELSEEQLVKLAADATHIVARMRGIRV